MPGTPSFTSALDLAHHIQLLFEKHGDVDTEEIISLMNSYTSNVKNEKDWKQYYHPNDIHYTRNLVFGNDRFELMVLVWRPSQATRIHDHNASRCWMAPLEGSVSETIYKVEPEDGASAIATLENLTVCPKLSLLKESLHNAGDVGFIEDDIGVHKLGNACNESDALTLHLYSPPIKQLTLFEPERGTVTTRKPGFYSIGGKRT